MTKPNVLYRFYDADDNLLYVGITNNPQTRFNTHRADKHWFKHVRRSTMQHYETRAELAAAEIAAIQADKPRYNVTHSIAPAPKQIGVSPRIGFYATDANKFTAPDSICDEPADTEARLDELEQVLDHRPVLIPNIPCPTCDLKLLTREHDGLTKCLNCQGMWTPEELTELKEPA